MEKNKNTYQRLLIVTDLRTVRVLHFKEAGDNPKNLAKLVELSYEELNAPVGAETTDGPGRFNRGFAAGQGEAMSHAETKLDIEIEKRAVAQIANEICDVVSDLGCASFVLTAPQEHLKRLQEDMTPSCRDKITKSSGVDLTKMKLKDLEKRFL